MIRVTLKPAQVFVGKHRIHHGFIGILLMLHDFRDWRVWIRDFWSS